MSFFNGVCDLQPFGAVGSTVSGAGCFVKQQLADVRFATPAQWEAVGQLPVDD